MAIVNNIISVLPAELVDRIVEEAAFSMPREQLSALSYLKVSKYFSQLPAQESVIRTVIKQNGLSSSPLTHLVFFKVFKHPLGEELTSCMIKKEDLEKFGVDNLRVLCSDLQELHFQSSLPLSSIIPIIQGTTQLQSLNLCTCLTLSDAELSIIATACSDLRSIDLSNCPAITDAGLAELVVKCPLLSSITLADLTGRSKISDRALSQLSTSSCLQVLDLGGCNITDAGLKELSRCSTLQSLTLMDCDKITREGVLHFSTLHALNLLGCERIRGQDIMDQLLGKNPDLQSLFLPRAKTPIFFIKEELEPQGNCKKIFEVY